MGGWRSCAAPHPIPSHRVYCVHSLLPARWRAFLCLLPGRLRLPNRGHVRVRTRWRRCVYAPLCYASRPGVHVVLIERSYYSIGGSGATNDTRTAQLPCEPGFFCVAGRKYPCPRGTYGTTKKLTSRYCSGWCPPGFYCPLASPAPLECPFNTYSTGGSPVCLSCPTQPLQASADTQHIQERCRDSRLCCNY